MQEDEAREGRLDPSSTADAAPPDAASVPPPTGGTRRGTFSGGIWSAASTVLPMGGTLALSVVISRELGADVLGQQSLVAYVGSMMVSVVIYSFTAASVQLLASATGARDDARLAYLSRWSFGAHLVGGTVAAAILVSIGLSRNDYQLLWFLAAATALVDSVGWAHASRDIARRGWAPTSARRLVAQAVSPFLAIAAVYAGWGVEGVFSVQLVVAVTLLAFLRRLDRDYRAPSTAGVDAPPWRPVLRLWSLFSLSFLITQVVERRLELVFLDRFHDAATVAQFSVAFNVIAIPLMLSASLIGAAMPAIAARHVQDPEVVLRTLSRVARIVVAVNLVLAAGTISLGPGLVSSVYGPQLLEGASLVRWLGLTLLVAPLGHLCNALWAGTGRLRPMLVAGGTGAVVDIALAWLLIPSLATVGAVVATVSAQAVTALVIITYTFRSGLRLELRPRRLLAAASVALAAGAAAAGTVAALDGWSGELLGILAFCGTTAVGARLVGLFDREDAEWLAQTVPGPAEKLLRALSPRR